MVHRSGERRAVTAEHQCPMPVSPPQRPRCARCRLVSRRPDQGTTPVVATPTGCPELLSGTASHLHFISVHRPTSAGNSASTGRGVHRSAA
jgi:hypothetical protein